MIRLKLTAAAAALAILFAAPVQAIGIPADPPPKDPPPVVTPEPPRTKPSGSDPLPLFSQPSDMPCCTRDGVILYHAPLGIDRAGTRAYCAALDVAVVPACKTWVAK